MNPTRSRILILALAFAVVAATLAIPASLPASQVTEAQAEQLHRVPDLLKFLDARPGALIADVGAGAGFFTVCIARAVGPTGRAVGEDISESALAELREHAERDGTYVDIVLGAPDDPHLEVGQYDAVLIHNAYHEMPEHESMLAHIHAALRPGGRLVVVEPMLDSSRDLTRDQQVAIHNIAPDIVERELRAAGFEVLARDDKFVDFQGGAGKLWLIVARRGPQTPAGPVA